MSQNEFDKADAFERRARSGTLPVDIWKYIPDKYQDGVDVANIETDGYWVWLEPGWVAYDGGEDCTVIHEYTVKDLRAAVATIRRAN